MDDAERAFVCGPFIEKYLPDVSSRDDVLHANILTRYLDGEEVWEGDLPWISAMVTREDVVVELIDIDSNCFRSLRKGKEELKAEFNIEQNINRNYYERKLC